MDKQQKELQKALHPEQRSPARLIILIVAVIIAGFCVSLIFLRLSKDDSSEVVADFGIALYEQSTIDGSAVEIISPNPDDPAILQSTAAYYLGVDCSKLYKGINFDIHPNIQVRAPRHLKKDEKSKIIFIIFDKDGRGYQTEVLIEAAADLTLGFEIPDTSEKDCSIVPVDVYFVTAPSSQMDDSGQLYDWTGDE